MSYLQEQIASLLRSAVIQAETEPYYEVLQSIKFSGVEYFDTGILGDINTKIEAGIFLTSMPSVESEGNYYIFGSRSGSATANNIDCIWSWQSGLVCDFNNSNYATYRLSVAKTNLSLNTVYDVTVNKNKRDVSRNGTSLGSNTAVNSDTFTSTNTICIGLVNGANISSYTGFNGGLKYFKIDDMDIIPVLDSQMRPCLYDRTNKRFLYAKKISDDTDATDTLTFTRWNKFDVDYISSAGSQEIATGLSGFTRFTGTAECTSLSSKSQVLLGDSSGGGHFFASRISTTQKWGTTTSSTSGYTSVDTLSKVDFDVSFASGKTFGSVNNESFTYSRTGTFSDFSIFVNATGNSYPFYGNLYELKAYQGDNLDELVRDLKPVVWHSSNTTAVACLYDEVYNKMYTNAGTGSFKAYIQNGSDVYEVGKSVSGTPSSSISGASNCFDTGLYGTQDTTVKYIAIGYDNNSTSGQLFGSYDGTQTTSKNLTINSTGTGNTAPIRFDGQVITTPIRIATGQSVSIVNSKYGLWVDDSLHGSWGSVNDFTTTTTLLILKCNNSTNIRNNGCGYCLILDKDEPVAEYIPVKNGSAIGLYDKVSKTVNTGVGTINFNVLD